MHYVAKQPCKVTMASTHSVSIQSIWIYICRAHCGNVEFIQIMITAITYMYAVQCTQTHTFDPWRAYKQNIYRWIFYKHHQFSIERNIHTHEEPTQCGMHNFSLTTECGMDCSCSLYVYEGQMEIQMQNCVKQLLCCIALYSYQNRSLAWRFDSRKGKGQQQKTHELSKRDIWIIVCNGTEPNRTEWNGTSGAGRAR